MSRCSKAEAAARSAPHNLSFVDLCRLAECYGFEFARQKGSHRRYIHASDAASFMTFQPDSSGQAKSYQVLQLLDWIDAHAGDANESP